jgi:hypothetical protein
MGRRRRLAIIASGVLAVAPPSLASAGDQPNIRPAGSGCPDGGDTTPVVDGFPARMSSLVGSDIRTGGHDCFERVVLELEGTGELPGYWVRYEADPILESPSGEPVDIAGEATMVLSVGVWMTDIEGNGYDGPTEIVPTNVTNILELNLIENFEGQHAWAIGLDQQREFRVTTLTEPTRIVIDIALDRSGAVAPTTAPSAPGTLPPTR